MSAAQPEFRQPASQVAVIHKPKPAPGPQVAMLPDGRRLHLHHGPIDLIIEAWGSPREVANAYQQATEAFQPLLAQLAAELPLLRTPIESIEGEPAGPVARVMLAAARAAMVPRRRFVTPMAAVAGAVAEHVLAAALEGRALQRAFVNNGGDIALHMQPGEHFDIAIVANPLTGETAGTVRLSGVSGVRGVATSGWRGRSFSLGIADAVTVLAKTAAVADVAATLIAGTVDLPDCAAIERVPATDIFPESDLGARPVTRGVGELSGSEIADALGHGTALAADMVAAGTIEAAMLSLQGQVRVVGPVLENQLPATQNDDCCEAAVLRGR